MEDQVVDQVPVIAVTAAVGAVILLLVLLCNVRKSLSVSKKRKGKNQTNGVSHSKKKAPPPQSKKAKPSNRVVKHSFSHPWLAGTLKGHGGNVLGLDFSVNNKYLISCAEDRTVYLWSVKDFAQKEHKSIRSNVELDHATKIKFSPDSRAFIVSLYYANTIRVYKIGKKDDGTPGNITAVLDFPQEHGNCEIFKIGIASNGKFIMTAYKDTTIILWDLKGEILAKIDTHQMSNSCCVISPCGRFVGSSGFTPDVKVWSVVFDKTSSFKEVSRAFELKGHNAGIYSFSFSNDSTRMASVAKDGTWKFWDTNIEYQLGQEPYLLHTGKFVSPGLSTITLAPDGLSCVIATGKTLTVFNTVSGNLAVTYENVHADEITEVAYDQGSKYIVYTGDRHICVFYNIPGAQAKVADLTEKKMKAKTHSIRERLSPQLDEARKYLENLLETVSQKTP